jgi:hypothetical protein
MATKKKEKKMVGVKTRPPMILTRSPVVILKGGPKS